MDINPYKSKLNILILGPYRPKAYLRRLRNPPRLPNNTRV